MDWESEFSLSEQSSESLQWREAVGRLTAGVHNERRSPEVLPFERSAVTEVESIIRQQTVLLETRRPEDKEIYQLDLDRVTYILKQYYRLRLMKLNTFHRHYSENPEWLSEGEKNVVSKLNYLEQKHLTDSFLHCLPEGQFQSVEKDQDMSMVATPGLDVFCFYRALVHIGDVAIDTGAISLEGGGVFLGKYTHIRNLLLQGRVQLV